MPDNTQVFCDEPQRDEETVEVTASGVMPALPDPHPPVMTDFDWLERAESNDLLDAVRVEQAVPGTTGTRSRAG